MSKRILGLLLFVFLLMGSVYARDPMGPMGLDMVGRKNSSSSTPSQSAIDACTGKSEGATCQVSEDGAGICNYSPDRKYFFCKSNNMPFEGRRGSDDHGGSGDNGVKDNEDGTSTGTF